MATTTGLINQQWIIRDYFGQQSRLSTTKPFWNVDHLTTFRGGCVFSYLHAAQRNSRLEVSWVTAQMFRSKSLQRKYCKVRNLVVTIRAGKSWMNTRSFYNFSWKWSKVNKDNYALDYLYSLRIWLILTEKSLLFEEFYDWHTHEIDFFFEWQHHGSIHLSYIDTNIIHTYFIENWKNISGLATSVFTKRCFWDQRSSWCWKFGNVTRDDELISGAAGFHCCGSS